MTRRTSPRRRSSARTKARRTPRSKHIMVIRSILVPIDFSIYSKDALRYAVNVAREFQAALRLVYVVEPTVYPADLGFGQVMLPEMEDELIAKGEEELQSLIQTTVGREVGASAVVRRGKPYHEILEEARAGAVDMIIVATHGHTGVEHMLFGSTAERIVRSAPCPVITIRPGIMEG